MLVRPDDGPVHIMRIPVEASVGIGLLLDRREEALPDARLAPAVQAARHRTPRAIARGQVTPWGTGPWGTGAEEPQDASEETAMVDGWTACFWLLWRQ
jgi:hypothetical protein